MTNTILLPPCTYQGGKHRVAVKIIDAIDSREHLLQNKTDFYDLCCGSGAITLELINRGFPTHKIHMCDAGPWGTFWKSVQENTLNPIQPQPKELLRRVTNIVTSCRGITCTNDDISTVQIPKNQTSIIYIDPPYPGTTSYGYDFDVMEQIARLLENSNTIYVSLHGPLGPDSIRLNLTGPKGGISGNKRQKHEEWLTRFKK